MPCEGSDRRVRNNGGMIINKGKQKKLEEKPNSLSFYPLQFSYEVTQD
jgi:hypothetical protein